MIVSALPVTHFCWWAITLTRCFARSVVDTHIGDVRRSICSADFILPVVLPFFVVGAVDGVGVAVDASLVAATGAATGVAFFIFFFVLVAA
jgi:hypothetical protein